MPSCRINELDRLLRRLPAEWQRVITWRASDKIESGKSTTYARYRRTISFRVS